MTAQKGRRPSGRPPLVPFTTQLTRQERKLLGFLSSLQERPAYRVVQDAIHAYVKTLPETERRMLEGFLSALQEDPDDDCRE